MLVEFAEDTAVNRTLVMRLQAVVDEILCPLLPQWITLLQPFPGLVFSFRSATPAVIYEGNLVSRTEVHEISSGKWENTAVVTWGITQFLIPKGRPY